MEEYEQEYKEQQINDEKESRQTRLPTRACVRLRVDEKRHPRIEDAL